jgi:hypothetical protein
VVVEVEVVFDPEFDLDPESVEDEDDSEEDAPFFVESDAAGLDSVAGDVPASAGLLSEELLAAFGA